MLPVRYLVGRPYPKKVFDLCDIHTRFSNNFSNREFLYSNLPRLELCWRKNIFYIVEQPISSLVFVYKPLKRLLRRHAAYSVTCALGAYGAPTLKPVPSLQKGLLITGAVVQFLL